MNLKIRVEITMEDVDEEIIEEMGLENYVRMCLEDDGMDCYVLDESYEVLEVEVA